ncbi:hydrophobic surface binding protein [Metarhizium brunneum]
MLSIKNLLFLAVAATGSVIKRDAAQVKQDLQTINEDTSAVTAAVNNYNGGGFANAIPIMTAQNKLSEDVKKATETAKNTGVVSDADANDIINYITSELQPNTETSLSALKAKKANFDADGLTPIVKNSLQDLKTDIDNLGAALIGGTPAALQAQAQAIQKKIDDNFVDAIAYYS